MSNFKNAKFIKNGLIDCLYEHPSLGWIPITLSSTDELTKNLFDEITDSDVIIEPYNKSISLVRRDKLKEIVISNTLEIDSKIFSTIRIDINKYKEATDISEGMGNENVDLYTGSGKCSYTIAEARQVLKTLSEKAYVDYWIKRDFIDMVNSLEVASDIEDLKAPGN